MSDTRSHWKKILYPSSSSGNIDPPHLLADLNISKASSSKSTSKIDSLGFLDVASGTDPIVDIIAIHGLQGHREGTWATNDGICWLRDFLPSDLSNARVLTYGYDADIRSRECVSSQTIRRHADTLVKALSRKRKDAPRRPIIFIGHDLGGIILKWALVICNNQRLGSKGDLRDILTSTHAILFFGTPHSGIENAGLLEEINRLASLHMKTTDVILKDLREHSSELETIQSLYVAASEKIDCIFFYEEYTTSSKINQRGLSVPYHSAVIAGDRNATTIVLHANHHDLVRFPDKRNENYQTVLHYLKDYVATAPAGVKEKWVIEEGCRNAAKGQLTSQEVVQPKRRPPMSICYVERTEIETLITQKLLPIESVQHQRRCILHGLGGAGKTQLATKWIRDNENRFTRVIIVDASSQAQLEADLERSVRCLGPEYGKMTWEDAVVYLDDKEKGWLLFIDNADSPDLKLDPYLPASIHGAIIITTRNRGCIGYAPNGAIPVGGLEESEAVKLLHATANVAPKSHTKSVEIVRALGMLALAITQAGAYIRSTRRLDTYLDTFCKHRARIMRKEPGSGANYLFSTYTAFDLSFQHLPAKTQEFLKLCAFLHHSFIPSALFEQSVVSGFTAKTVLKGSPPPEIDKVFISKLEGVIGREWDEVTFQEIVDSAAQASFINLSTDGAYYTVHPLLQTYIKDGLDEEERMICTRTAAQLLLGAMRFLEHGNTERLQLLPHANGIPRSVQSENTAHALVFCEFYDSLGDWKACRELLESALSETLPTRGRRHSVSLWLTSKLASILSILGLFDEAEKMEREVLSLRLEILGGRHPDTIWAMNGLANTLQMRGRLDETEKIRRDVLALWLEILGGRHPNTIMAMHNLAYTLEKRGQLCEAEQMQREVFSLRLELLGQHHPDTIATMSNLANTLSIRGQLNEAEEMQRDALALQLEVLGERHPDTIATMNNLANTLQNRGQWDEAEKMQRDVLALQLEIFGRRHPDTIGAMFNLATTLQRRGQLGEAEKMHQDVLGLRLEVLGSRHPDTISAMSNLANSLLMRGQLDEAEQMQRDALSLRLDVLGQRHPDTISAMSNLANTLKIRGQLDEAEKMHRTVLAMRLKILGLRHPDTISAMSDLADTLRMCGQLDEAEQMQREVLALRLKILGEKHADTVNAMNNLAATLQTRGQLDEAESIQRDVLALQLEILGQRHPDTIVALSNLAATLVERGQLGEAETMQRDALALRLALLGQRHPHTLSATYNLSRTLCIRHQFGEAIQLLQPTMRLRVQVLGEGHPRTRNSEKLLKYAISMQSCSNS